MASTSARELVETRLPPAGTMGQSHAYLDAAIRLDQKYAAGYINRIAHLIDEALRCIVRTKEG